MGRHCTNFHKKAVDRKFSDEQGKLHYFGEPAERKDTEGQHSNEKGN